MPASALVLAYTFSGPIKADLPEEVLEDIAKNTDLLSASPLIFRLQNGFIDKAVGVREFSAPPSQIGLHEEIAQALQLQVGDIVDVESVNLPRGTEITLKLTNNSDTSATSEINWKSLLESWIPQNCTALSLGDQLRVPYLATEYTLEVTHLEPGNRSVCVVDTDMSLIIESDPKFLKQNETDLINNAQTNNTSFNLVFDENLQLPDSTTTLLSADTPSSTDHLFITCSNLGFIGPEHATSPSAYTAVADPIGTEVSPLLLGPRLSILASGELRVATKRPLSSSTHRTEKADPNFVLCQTCDKLIPQQSYMLHSSRCSRNSSQCPHCAQKFGGLPAVPEAHLKLHELKTEGSGGTCECDDYASTTAIELAFHKAQACRLAMHICRFCHLLLARGPTSPVDLAMGLSGHESQCGNRTTDCPVCKRAVRLRSLDAHLSDHDTKRKLRKPPAMCANQNCPYCLPAPNEPNRPPANLCATCFGPLSVPGANADFARVKQRMERRYVLQMTRGCGKLWCLNECCAMNRKRDVATAMADTRKILSDPEGRHWFCVNDVQTRKSMFVQIQDEYARGWRGMAISQCSTEVEAENWLQTNASKLNE